VRLGIAAAAAAAAAVGGILLLPDGTTPLSPVPANAAEVLNASARAAGAAPVTDGTYWRIRTHEVLTLAEGSRTLHRSLDTTHWIRKDGQGWTSFDGAAPTVNAETFFSLCDKSVDYSAVAALPSDPRDLGAALAAVVVSRADAPPARYTDVVVSECALSLLAELPASPPVRAAAFRYLADRADVTVLGPATDTQGRHGTELEFTLLGTHEDVIVDQSSGTLLQLDQESGPAPQPGRPASGKSSQETVIEAGWTDTPPPGA
jgi:hypothetical protein